MTREQIREGERTPCCATSCCSGSRRTFTPATIREIEAAFAALKGKIETIEALEWGTDCSPEGKAQGFTHCFLLTFADAAGRDAYLPHPDHQAFSALLRPHVDQVLVVDYVPGA